MYELIPFISSKTNYSVHKIVEVITVGSKTNYVVKTKTWLIKAFIIVGYTRFVSVACYYDP
ncbi:MAG: hypothetical protein HXS48_03840 [Theionarchaea archaeon]|nr:MAG: hypothetical protein AYK19_10850 [Theionarchaea archaeon DG-70-1]MBU7026051.1 hypothetical protein [Theionarchaea archaeon]